jgi:hypothetical protein
MARLSQLGTTYNVEVYDYDGTTLLRSSSIGGTSYSYTTGDAIADGDPPAMWFKIESVRDSIPSWQYYWINVSRPFTFDSGFDFDFDGSL